MVYTVFDLSLRSRRKHKAWGASTRELPRDRRARENGRQLLAFAHFAGSAYSNTAFLGLAPQALCFHLLRKLEQPFDGSNRLLRQTGFEI